MSEPLAENVHHLEEPKSPLLAQWERWRPMFAEAMDEAFYSIEALEQKIAHQRALFFPGKEAALVTEVITYEGGERVMQTLWAVGDLNEIVQMAPGIEAIARMMGCTSMLVEGREAWKKVLKDQGYDLWSVTLRKAL